MSADKNKLLIRMLLILESRNPCQAVSGVYINCVGGYGSKNPVIVQLVRRGYLKRPLASGTPPKKFGERRFRDFFGPYGIHGHAPRQFYSITDEGRKFFDENKHKIRPEVRKPHWDSSLGEYAEARRNFRKNSVYWT